MMVFPPLEEEEDDVAAAALQQETTTTTRIMKPMIPPQTAPMMMAMLGVEREDEEDQSYLEDSTFDASLYTSNGPMTALPLPPPTTVEGPLLAVHRVGGSHTVEI